MALKVAINLSGWLLWLKKGVEDEVSRLANEAVESASAEVIAMAKKNAENYRELAPKAEPRSIGVDHYSSAGLEPWPEETERVWKRVILKELPALGTRTFFAVVPNPR